MLHFMHIYYGGLCATIARSLFWIIEIVLLTDRSAAKRRLSVIKSLWKVYQIPCLSSPKDDQCCVWRPSWSLKGFPAQSLCGVSWGCWWCCDYSAAQFLCYRLLPSYRCWFQEHSQINTPSQSMLPGEPKLWNMPIDSEVKCLGSIANWQ